ncbi:MAG TPA: hypothetical protein VHV08_05640, partial [Pirellulales bacterium]|nr:hypothetical protein [Pirellulales bacterium]
MASRKVLRRRPRAIDRPRPSSVRSRFELLERRLLLTGESGDSTAGELTTAQQAADLDFYGPNP